MASTIDIVTRVFAGYRTEGDLVILARSWPEKPVSAQCGVLHRGQRLQVRMSHDAVEVTADRCGANPRVRVRVWERASAMTGGQGVVVAPHRVSVAPASPRVT